MITRVESYVIYLLSPCPLGRNHINLFYLRLRLASFEVLRNTLPPFLPPVPCSVIESYKCGGTHIKDQSETVQLRFSGHVLDAPKNVERWQLISENLIILLAR